MEITKNKETGFQTITVKIEIQSQNELNDLIGDFRKTSKLFAHTDSFNKLFRFFSNL